MEIKHLQDFLYQVEQENVLKSEQLLAKLKRAKYNQALKEIRSALANPIY